jgi:hypothetical protein
LTVALQRGNAAILREGLRLLAAAPQPVVSSSLLLLPLNLSPAFLLPALCLWLV